MINPAIMAMPIIIAANMQQQQRMRQIEMDNQRRMLEHKRNLETAKQVQEKRKEIKEKVDNPETRKLYQDRINEMWKRLEEERYTDFLD